VDQKELELRITHGNISRAASVLGSVSLVGMLKFSKCSISAEEGKYEKVFPAFSREAQNNSKHPLANLGG
jgi:hypothetical protein